MDMEQKDDLRQTDIPSPKNEQERREIIARQPAEPWRINRMKMAGIETVSYTHLTLPTIYSV